MEKENMIYGGLIRRQDGWYQWWSDGNKHYLYEKYDESKEEGKKHE